MNKLIAESSDCDWAKVRCMQERSAVLNGKSIYKTFSLLGKKIKLVGNG